jgi:hypothetical protein
MSDFKRRRNSEHQSRLERIGMSQRPPDRDMRDVRLEALIRKALADAWAEGATEKEAQSMTVQFVQKVFPDILESEVCLVINSLRR